MSPIPVRRSASLAVALAAAAWSPIVQAQLSPQARAMMQSCRADYRQFCSTVPRGGGRILACLESHARELSPSCGEAMTKALALKNKTAKGSPAN